MKGRCCIQVNFNDEMVVYGQACFKMSSSSFMVAHAGWMPLHNVISSLVFKPLNTTTTISSHVAMVSNACWALLRELVNTQWKDGVKTMSGDSIVYISQILASFARIFSSKAA